jgi:hypothetical protein
MDSLGPVILAFLLAGISLLALMVLVACKSAKRRPYVVVAALATVVASAAVVIRNHHADSATSLILNTLILCPMLGSIFLVLALFAYTIVSSRGEKP